MSTNMGGTVSDAIVLANYLGNTFINNQTVYRRVAYWDYPSPRVRPKPLTTTAAKLIVQFRNGKQYSYGSRKGEVTFVYGSFVVEQVVTSGNDPSNKALNKLGSGDLDLGVTIAELDQTANMVWKRLRQLYLILQAFRARDWTKLRDQFSIKISRKGQLSARWLPPDQVAASLWLEWHLGWKQLANDIYGALSEFQKGIRTRGSVVRARVGGRARVELNSKSVKDSRFLYDATDPPKLVSQAAAFGRVRDPNVRTLQQLGLINPLAIAWEKTRLSFVFDWIIPLGDVFQALTAGAGLDSVRGYKTIETRTITRFASGAPKGIITQVQRRFNRTPLTGVAVPWLNINLASTEKIATAISLVTQANKTRYRNRYYLPH